MEPWQKKHDEPFVSTRVNVLIWSGSRLIFHGLHFRLPWLRMMCTAPRVEVNWELFYFLNTCYNPSKSCQELIVLF
jgi:hypothetical protein